MGCHTWYKKLITNDQKEIINKIKDVIISSRDYSWYEFTSLEDLFDSDELWVMEIAEYVYDNIDDLVKVNGVFGLYDEVDIYSVDEPRIGNYPETIITSADDMFKAMETGLTGWRGNHCDFYWDKNRDDVIRKNIIDFFNQYPDGIITFG